MGAWGSGRRLGRQTIGVVAGMLLALGGMGPPAATAAPVTARTMAITAMRQLDSDFYSPRQGLYLIAGDSKGPTASLWPTSQVLNAAIVVATLTKAPTDWARVRRIIASLARYAAPGGVYHTRTFASLRYTDDNNWIALDLLDAYDALHDPAYLAEAERIFRYLTANWSPRGGILWGDTHSDLPTVSTAPAITIGMRLSAITHQASYRTWAERFYTWENAHLRAPSGLYWDHVRGDGSIDTTLWSYNQGVMIAADLACAAVSGDRTYLDAARRLATVAATALAGKLKSRGNQAAFDAIYFQALGLLDARSPGTASLAPLHAYLQWAWPTAGAPRSIVTEQALLEQAAFVVAAGTAAG